MEKQSNMNIKETFDNEAKEYEFTSRAVNIYFDNALEILVKNIKLKSRNSKILDVCCGTGILTKQVADKFPNAQFVGVDFSSGMLEIAKKRMENYNFNGVLCDICDTTNMSKLGEFDLVVSSFGIHNVHGIENKRIALNNILAHLKTGGQFITCDLLKGNNKKEIEHFYNFQKEWLLKTYSLKETEEWLKLLAEEDEPETLKNNFELLKNANIENCELIWQKEFLGIWRGKKL